MEVCFYYGAKAYKTLKLWESRHVTMMRTDFRSAGETRWRRSMRDDITVMTMSAAAGR